MFYNHGYCFSEKSLCLKRAHFRKIVWNTGPNPHQRTLNRCIKTTDNGLFSSDSDLKFAQFSQNVYGPCLMPLTFLNLRRHLNIFTKCSLIIRVKAKQITPLLWCQIFPNKFRLLQNMNLIASLWKMSACRCDYIFGVVIWETKFSNVLSFFSSEIRHLPWLIKMSYTTLMLSLGHFLLNVCK